MISHFVPACTAPRTDFRVRKRASLVQPAAGVFEARGDASPGGSRGQGAFRDGPEAPDIQGMQQQAAQSRLRFDTVFQDALRGLDLEPSSESGDDYEIR